MTDSHSKTSDALAPILAILAGVPRGIAPYLGQIVRLAGWSVAGEQEGAAKASVRMEEGQMIFQEHGIETIITLPVRAEKILQYLQAVSSGAHYNAGKITIGPYQLMPQDFLIVDAAGQAVRLTEKETAILIALAKANGKPVSRQALLDNVWAYAEGVETHTLETHIYRLRQKIEENPASPTHLITLDEGYALAS